MSEQLSKTEARQGETTGHVRWILGASISLAVIGLAAVGIYLA
jgi:hypothetical protein